MGLNRQIWNSPLRLNRQPGAVAAMPADSTSPHRSHPLRLLDRRPRNSATTTPNLKAQAAWLVESRFPRATRPFPSLDPAAMTPRQWWQAIADVPAEGREMKITAHLTHAYHRGERSDWIISVRCQR